MASRWRPVWAAMVPRLLSVICAAIVVHLVFGAAWGWAVAAVGATVMVYAQTRQLIALESWLESPESVEFPDAQGLWGEIFARLARRLRADGKDRQLIEDELNSFKRAIEVLPEGVVFLDSSHRIRWCNDAAGAHLGIQQSRDMGAIVSQLVRTPGFAEYLELAEAHDPFVLRTEAAQVRYYALQFMSFGERNKILLSRDVTDAQRVESMRRDFVANVAHELRTPLTVVSGFLEHFREEELMSAAERRHFVGLMSAQAERMLNLVNDLLMLSRLESGDAPAVEEHIDMNQMLAQLLSEAQSMANNRHRIDASADGDGAALYGNRGELHSAFGNLVSNAVRYTPDGGDIHIAWTRRGDLGAFSVSDSGLGIAAEHLPRLTERFYRVDRGLSRDAGGTGLGLAIVKHVLLRHQATLSIESTVGAGSTFRAEFPGIRLRPPAATGSTDKDVPGLEVTSK